MATTKIRSSSIEDGQVSNADLSATIAVTGGQIADDAVTLAKMAGGTDGNLITYDASGDPAHVVTGSATHVLTSNGAGAAPTFQAPAAGGIAASEIKGWRIRPIFTWATATTIKLGGVFSYQHDGSTTQIVSGENVTFTRSDTSGVIQFNYLYLDDSAIVTAGNSTITASELISSTTAPTLNTTKGGFYNGNDRCIYAFKQDASDNIYRFFNAPQFGVPGVVASEASYTYASVGGAGYGTSWHQYTIPAADLPRPCGPDGLAVGLWTNLGGTHSTIYTGPDTHDWDLQTLPSPNYRASVMVDSLGRVNVRSDYAHSSYTHVFTANGWTMSPFL